MLSARPKASTHQILECPSCQARINHISSRMAPKNTRICPKCGGTVQIPQCASNAE